MACRAAAGQLPRPLDSAVNRNGGDHTRLERHPSPTLGGQYFLGLEIANPQEDQLAAFHSLKGGCPVGC